MKNELNENLLNILEDTIDNRIESMLYDVEQLQSSLTGLKKYKRLIFEDVKKALKRKRASKKR